MAITAAPAPSNFNTGQVWRHDRDHFLHPWTHFDSFKAEGSLVIAEGEGAYVYDCAGKRYLDGIGGLWCVNIGYGNEEMVRGDRRSGAPAGLLLIVRRYHQSRRRRNWPPSSPRSRPAISTTSATPAPGSDANDTAVRLAHYYHARRGKPSKKHIIARIDGYHGSHLSRHVADRRARPTARRISTT